MSAWERFWYPQWSLRRLALFRLAVAWICLYDAFLYDPRHLVANSERVEATWHPIVAFDLLGITVPDQAIVAALATAYQWAVLGMLLGFRTRTMCLLVALLSFWQGGLFYSLTKVRHDRVVLCFATFALACAPAGAELSLDAFWRRVRGRVAPDMTWAAWPIVLTQVTLAIGYYAAGLSKLLQPGWMNGYTLQGIILGHRGRFADAAAADVLLCQALSVVTVAAELLTPLCLWWPRLLWAFLPLLIGFHLGTWATMDTGPYLTLWYLWIAFVPLDRLPAWAAAEWSRRRWWVLLVAAAAAGCLAVVGYVMVTVVPWWMLALAVAATLGHWRIEPRSTLVLSERRAS